MAEPVIDAAFALHVETVEQSAELLGMFCRFFKGVKIAWMHKDNASVSPTRRLDDA